MECSVWCEEEYTPQKHSSLKYIFLKQSLGFTGLLGLGFRVLGIEVKTTYDGKRLNGLLESLKEVG
jgi:hypothetical protein